jgi:thiamine biosynthesis protein ThiS
VEGLGRGDPGVVKVTINGEARTVERARNVTELIDELGLPAPAMLVEHNGLALRREEWPARTLTDGDRVEIVRIVAGG